MGISNKVINSQQLSIVGFWVLYQATCSVRKVSSVSVISAEACFVYVHQLFVDASRELHRVEQGWLYRFSHLCCAPEEIRFCLLRIPVYWQQHLLWIFCKAFYMVNPILYSKNSIQIKTIWNSFFLPLHYPHVHSLLLLNKIKKIFFSFCHLCCLLAYFSFKTHAKLILSSMHRDFSTGVITAPISPAFNETTVGGRCFILGVFDLRCLWRDLAFKKTSSKVGIQNLRCSKVLVCGNLSFSFRSI